MGKLIYGSKFIFILVGVAFLYFCLMVFFLYQKEGNSILGLMAIFILLWSIFLYLSVRVFTTPKFKLIDNKLYVRRVLFWYKKTCLESLSVHVKKNLILLEEEKSTLKVRNSYATKRVFRELVNLLRKNKSHLGSFKES